MHDLKNSTKETSTVVLFSSQNSLPTQGSPYLPKVCFHFQIAEHVELTDNIELPPSTMVSHSLAIAKASLAAGMIRPDPTSIPKPEIARFHTLLEDVLEDCSSAKIQV